MNKMWISIGIGIALLVDIALFAGIGFGAGILSVAAPSSSSSTSQLANYQTTNFFAYTSFEVSVAITSYTSAGQIPTTSFTSGGQSNTITATVNIINPVHDNCGNSNNPTWDPGVGADYGTMVVQFTNPFTAIIGGQPVSSGSGNQILIPFASLQGGANNELFSCMTGPGGDQVTQNLQNSGTTVSESFTIVGQYQQGVLLIGFIGQGNYCNALASTGVTPVCQAADNYWDNSGYYTSTNGFSINANAQINTYSGQATITNANPNAVYYNGGTATFLASTGYDGPGPPAAGSPYVLTMSYPAARGGGNDPNFLPINVPNFCAPSCTESWTIPAGTSQLSSTQGWNTFIAVLTASIYVTGFAKASIAISPQLQPNAPLIQTSNTGKFIAPQPGDTETITVTAYPSASSGPVASLFLTVYYALVTSAAGALPPCGAVYVTSGCASGQSITLTALSGGGGTGTFQFVVNPPAGATDGFWITAQSQSTGAQPSNTTYQWVTITPLSCVQGGTGCPPGASTSYWSWVGPLLLSLGFLLAGIFIFVMIPETIIRIVAIAAPVLFIILGYLLLFPSWFSPGGLFAPGL